MTGSDNDADLRAELEAARERIRELEAIVTTDPLTGLLNRRGLEDSFEKEQARIQRHQSPGALLVIIDLDRFKQINDTYGHDAGDAALQLVSDKLRHAVRMVDSEARIGGDEFSALMTNARPEMTQTTAYKIQSLLNDTTLDWNGQKIHVGASVGVSFVSADSSFEDAYRAADQDMYAHKEQRHAAEKLQSGRLRQVFARVRNRSTPSPLPRARAPAPG